MKSIILAGCLILGLTGCTTYRGGVASSYDTTYGSDWSTADSTWYMSDSIYPVRRQPSIKGDDMGGVRPVIDPTRMYDMGYYWERHEPANPRSTAPVEPVERAYAPRDPFLR